MNVKHLNEIFSLYTNGKFKYADIDAKSVYDNCVNKDFGSHTFEEAKAFKDYVGIDENTTEEELRAIRNTLVRYWADNMDKTDEGFKMGDQMQFFTTVIDMALDALPKDESINEGVKNDVPKSNGKNVDYIDEECYDVAKKICDIIKKVIKEFYNFNSDEEVDITLFDSSSMQGTHLQINFYTPTVIYNAGSIIIHKFFNTNHIANKDIDNKVHIFTGDLTSMAIPEVALSDVEYIVTDYLKKQEKNESLNEKKIEFKDRVDMIESDMKDAINKIEFVVNKFKSYANKYEDVKQGNLCEEIQRVLQDTENYCSRIAKRIK